MDIFYDRKKKGFRTNRFISLERETRQRCIMGTNGAKFHTNVLLFWKHIHFCPQRKCCDFFREGGPLDADSRTHTHVDTHTHLSPSMNQTLVSSWRGSELRPCTFHAEI